MTVMLFLPLMTIMLFLLLMSHVVLVSFMKSKVRVSFYIAQYPVLRTAQSAFTLYFPDRPVQSDTISTSLGSIQPRATINVQRAAHIHIHHCLLPDTHLYS